MTDQSIEPKKKGKFWKVLLKVVTIGLVVSKVWVKDERIKETAGEILENLPDNK